MGGPNRCLDNTYSALSHKAFQSILHPINRGRRGKYVPPPNPAKLPDGTVTPFDALEASTIGGYNGFTEFKEMKDMRGKMRTYRSCWKFDETASPGQRWYLHDTDENYIRKVSAEYNKGGCP